MTDLATVQSLWVYWAVPGDTTYRWKKLKLDPATLTISANDDLDEGTLSAIAAPPSAPEKTLAVDQVYVMQPDATWLGPDLPAIDQGTQRVYRNGLRMLKGFDYTLDPAKPRAIAPVLNWSADDTVIADFYHS